MSTPVLESPPNPQSSRRYTPEDLLRMPDGHRFELIDGELVERNMGAESSQVAMNLMVRVGFHVRTNKLGKVFAPDCGYQIFPQHPNRVRFADGSFIARGRLPDERTPQGHVMIPPDMAAEVVSPNDTADEVETKRIAYMQAGVRLLWVIYPETRSLHVFRQGGTATLLGPDDELSGEDVLPGFACRVGELFED
jgi:Uma2 family endonuclease